MDFIIIVIVVCVIFGFIGMGIGDLGRKNNGSVGFALGALLGPVGWIITAVIPANATDQSKSESPTSLSPSEKAKIQELESQLAALKNKSASPMKPSKQALNSDDDGGIPTYKLD